MLTVHNVRLGFATNSSSSHSLIIVPPGTPERDSDLDGGNFGWQTFMAGTRETKMEYLALLFRDSAVGLPREYERLMERELFGVVPDDDADIDHQSVMRLPRAYGSTVPDAEFVKALAAFFAHPQLRIRGGNDNDMDDDVDHGIPFPIEREGDSEIVIRNDGTHWVLFNQRTGAKLRFTLAPGAEPAMDAKRRHWDNEADDYVTDPATFDAPRAAAPELVDLKITDCCPFNCPFCYQGSMPEGKHAKADDVMAILRALAGMKVFEVAIGGGEPTIHPQFGHILQTARSLGIVPNFSTRSLAWMRDEALRRTVLENCGGFAFSARSEKDVEELAIALQYHHLREPTVYGRFQVGVHVIVQPGREWDVESVLKGAQKHHLNATLLAYKTNGRGAAHLSAEQGHLPQWQQREGIDHKVVIDALSRCHPGSVGIDTPLAAKLRPSLEKAGVWDRLYSVEEGTHSCYIDSVERAVAPSSYCDPSRVVAYPHGNSTWRWAEFLQKTWPKLA